MISLETIEREIDELEATASTTYSACERLAWLYIVRDHLKPPTVPDGVKAPEISPLSGSEFVELASTISWPSFMEVMDEHMSAVSVVQPREYEAVMNRLRALV